VYTVDSSWNARDPISDNRVILYEEFSRISCCYEESIGFGWVDSSWVLFLVRAQENN
jgi:hypothetical protein